MRLEEIAKLLSGKIEGDSDLEITDVGKIQTADKNDITFISNPLYEKYYESTNAGAIIVSEDFTVDSSRSGHSLVRVADPYISFLKLLEIFEKNDSADVHSGISGNCSIDLNTELGDDIYIGNFVSIGKNCKVGSSTKIYSNCVIENDVTIGNSCIIYPNVTIYKGCQIRDNVIIHSGTVIGADGFGFVKEEDASFKKIPQTGIVLIEDDVEIGSNCSIDRATLDETRICKGVKIDNQVMIAHNVYIGENTAIAAQVGIAGSTRVGKRCLIGGQSGIVGHITICDDVVIGASVGVAKSIDKPGTYTGYRARPIRDTLRSEVEIKNLQKLEAKIKNLEKRLL